MPETLAVQEDWEFQASLGYMKPCVKKRGKKRNGREEEGEK